MSLSVKRNLLRAFSIILCLYLFQNGVSAQIQDTTVSNQYLKEGVEQMDDKSYDAAIESFNNAIRYNEKNYKAFERRGFCRMKLEDVKEKSGDRDYTMAITDFSAALMALEDLIDQTKDYSYKKKLRKEKAPILINRGWAKIQIDKKKYYKLAIDDFNEAFKFDNTLIELYIGRAYAYHKRDEFQREINDYRYIIREADKADSKVREIVDLKIMYYNLGNAYIDWNNDRKNACESYKKSLNLGFEDAKEKVMTTCDL